MSTPSANRAEVRPRVVIAEDFVLIQEMMRELLESSCDVVELVEDGPAALKAVVSASPDVLLLDVSLPGASGFGVAEQVARTHPAVKIMFVTAHADPVYVERAFEIGAKAYLLKSSLRLELVPAVRAVVEGKLYRSAMLRSQAE